MAVVGIATLTIRSLRQRHDAGDRALIWGAALAESPSGTQQPISLLAHPRRNGNGCDAFAYRCKSGLEAEHRVVALASKATSKPGLSPVRPRPGVSLVVVSIFFALNTGYRALSEREITDNTRLPQRAFR